MLITFWLVPVSLQTGLVHLMDCIRRYIRYSEIGRLVSDGAVISQVLIRQPD